MEKNIEICKSILKNKKEYNKILADDLIDTFPSKGGYMKQNILSPIYNKLNLKQKILVKVFKKDILEISNMVRQNTVNEMIK